MAHVFMPGDGQVASTNVYLTSCQNGMKRISFFMFAHSRTFCIVRIAIDLNGGRLCQKKSGHINLFQ